MVLIKHIKDAFQFLIHRAARADFQFVRQQLVDDGDLPFVLRLLVEIQLALFYFFAQLLIVFIIRRSRLLRRIAQLDGLGQRKELSLLGLLGQLDLRGVPKTRNVMRNRPHPRVRFGCGLSRFDDLIQFVHLAAAVPAAAAVIRQQLAVVLHMRVQRIPQALRAAAGIGLLHAFGIAAYELAGNIRRGGLIRLCLGRRLRLPVGGLVRTRRGRPQRFVRAGRLVQQRADIQFSGRSAAHCFNPFLSNDPCFYFTCAAAAPPRKSQPKPQPIRSASLRRRTSGSPR